MNIDLLSSNFRADNFPVWPCPHCGADSLTVIKDGFKKQNDSYFDDNHPCFDPIFIGYVFTLNMQCSVPTCGCGVVCIGTGDISQEYLSNGSSEWSYFDNFEIKYFHPPLQIFKLPVNTPDSVKNALKESFATYFSSPRTSLFALRLALEVLLDEMEVKSVDDKSNFLSLAKRISLLSPKHQEIIEPATAIRWLGNDGVHSGRIEVNKSDVFDGYRIFKHILENLYPEKIDSLADLITRINEDKGVKK